MNLPGREQIRRRIAAAQARDAAGHAPEIDAVEPPAPRSGQAALPKVVHRAIETAKAHPLATLAGAAGIGLALALLLRRPGKAKAPPQARSAPRLLGLATLLAEIALNVVKQVRQQERPAGHRPDETSPAPMVADRPATSADGLGHEASPHSGARPQGPPGPITSREITSREITSREITSREIGLAILRRLREERRG